METRRASSNHGSGHTLIDDLGLRALRPCLDGAQHPFLSYRLNDQRPVGVHQPDDLLPLAILKGARPNAVLLPPRRLRSLTVAEEEPGLRTRYAHPPEQGDVVGVGIQTELHDDWP